MAPELENLEATLLNTSGNVPLHSRFRALFTLKALKNEWAIRIISDGANLYPHPFCNAKFLNRL
jgi:deoxyhypusine monooxygenase